jgi:hypothetical protein
MKPREYDGATERRVAGWVMVGERAGPGNSPTSTPNSAPLRAEAEYEGEQARDQFGTGLGLVAGV